MKTPSKTIAVLDSVAESLDECSPRLAAEIDAVAFAIREVHQESPAVSSVLDKVAEALEARGAYKLSSLVDNANEVIAGEIEFQLENFFRYDNSIKGVRARLEGRLAESSVQRDRQKIQRPGQIGRKSLPERAEGQAEGAQRLDQAGTESDA